jgi:hypothetical protein
MVARSGSLTRSAQRETHDPEREKKKSNQEDLIQ